MGMPKKEVSDALGDWLWTLHVKQVPHAFNSAVLDLWER